MLRTLTVIAIDLRVLGSFDSPGNHYIDVDSKGNIYTNGNHGADGQRRPHRYLLKSAIGRPASR
jgi:hypothetical protein